jgi:hypothetical protein
LSNFNSDVKPLKRRSQPSQSFHAVALLCTTQRDSGAVVARFAVCSWFSMRLKTGVDGDGARGDDDSEASR